MLTLFRCPLITENKHLLRDPELSIVTRNCQLSNLHHAVGYSKDRDLQIKRFYELYQSKAESFVNSIYSSVSPDFRFKETPYVNFFTDPELSSSLYSILYMFVLTTGH